MSQLLLIAGMARALAAQGPSTATAHQNTVPLVGSWRLNLTRTHYGVGVDVRRQESLTCDLSKGLLHCEIRSIRQDGRALKGAFTAPLDGATASVTGIPDVDSVQLRQPTPSLMDATFSFRGRAVFGYRAYTSSDAQSLLIVAVDPISRAALTSVVVYDRR